VHEQTPEQRSLSTKAPLFVVTPSAGPGTTSPFVGLLQQRLAALGYAVPTGGSYDAGTERAVLAYRKVRGLDRITTLSPEVVDGLLRGVGSFHVRYPQHGRHVEANLGQQVLALIEGGKVVRTYLTSSGKPSTPTVLGTFRFYWKDLGTNSLGMVDSAYFHGGYAIHGYVDVPTYNASHGCLRVPIPDARAIFDWVRLGDQIDVYY
jgi:peptidoglycan hydrolase-like protein with peptidoglycan-binding domain